MHQDRIQELSEKILSGKASDSEILEFSRLCNSFSQNDKEWDEELLGNQSRLEASIRESIWANADPGKNVVKMYWFRWAAAAAIFILISTIGYYLINVRTGKKTHSDIELAQNELKNVIAPGQHGAILTLASGQKILIDSSVNGRLAQQGNAQVIKKNGELVYATDGKNTDVVYNTMTTPRGRQFDLVLADGSRVWLNAASSITFPTSFIGKERKVTITGEAYFEIAHNPAMPFIVEKGNASVVVLGTHFNVNTYDDEPVISVTLLEGSVNVLNVNAAKLLKPGEQAQISRDDQIRVIKGVNVENIIAWKNGRIQFEGVNLETVMRQMARWYDVEIEYNKKLDDFFYADISRSTTLNDVLKALEINRDVHFKIEGRKVSVVP